MKDDNNKSIDFVLIFPPELVLEIFRYLPPPVLCELMMVSFAWATFARDEVLWKKLVLEKFSEGPAEAVSNSFKNKPLDYKGLYKLLDGTVSPIDFFQRGRFSDLYRLDIEQLSSSRHLFNYEGKLFPHFLCVETLEDIELLEQEEMQDALRQLHINSDRIREDIKVAYPEMPQDQILQEMIIAHEKIMTAIQKCKYLRYLSVLSKVTDEIFCQFLELFIQHQSLRECTVSFCPAHINEKLRQLYARIPSGKLLVFYGYINEQVRSLIPPASLKVISNMREGRMPLYADACLGRQDEALIDIRNREANTYFAQAFSHIQGLRKLTIHFDQYLSLDAKQSFAFSFLSQFNKVTSLRTCIMHNVPLQHDEIFFLFMQMLRNNSNLKTVSIKRIALTKDQLTELLSYVLAGHSKIKMLGLSIGLNNVAALEKVLSSSGKETRKIELHINVAWSTRIPRREATSKLEEQVLQSRVSQALVNSCSVTAVNISFFEDPYLLELMQHSQSIVDFTGCNLSHQEILTKPGRNGESIQSRLAQNRDALGKDVIPSAPWRSGTIRQDIIRYFRQNIFCVKPVSNQEALRVWELVVACNLQAVFKESAIAKVSKRRSIDYALLFERVRQYGKLFAVDADSIFSELKHYFLDYYQKQIKQYNFVELLHNFPMLMSFNFSDEAFNRVITVLCDCIYDSLSLSRNIDDQNRVARVELCKSLLHCYRDQRRFSLEVMLDLSVVLCHVGAQASDLSTQRECLITLFSSLNTQGFFSKDGQKIMCFKQAVGDLSYALEDYDQAKTMYEQALHFLNSEVASNDDSQLLRQKLESANRAIELTSSRKRKSREYPDSKRPRL